LKKQNDDTLSEMGTMEAEYKELNTKFEDLTNQNSLNLNKIKTMEAQYAELKQQYDELAQPGEITEGDIEQILFELINQARTNNGKDALSWGPNLFKVAQTNNRHMIDSKIYEYPQSYAIIEVFWATGYDTAEEIANAALVVWKNNPSRYQNNLLNNVATYGAVDANISGEIAYITFVAATYD
jgi:hypothetical protein